MAHVVLKDVTKIYGKNVIAVNRVNLEVRDREFVVLVGPSGCGKSTILRMIAGLEDITEGEIFIDDRLVNSIQAKDRDIAMVFQNYALYPHMTVFDNMAFGLKLRKIAKNEIQDRVRDAADILGITDLLERKPKQLSGGQRQRVAVGRAIVRKPKVFLFDEPLSNLDAKLRVQMRKEISKLHQKLQATMIYVTHDQVEAMTMGDRIVVLKDGCTQQIDVPMTLYNKPENQFVAGFIGSPPMNIFNGKIVKESGLWFDEGQFKLKVPSRFEKNIESYVNKEIIFGIRPEDIHQSGDKSDNEFLISVNVNVEVVEPMGNEVILYSSVGKHSAVARLDVQCQIKPGEDINLFFNIKKGHFFNAETKMSICLEK
ncbi:sn-glycerol-3-phosphate ABC transporter ATP-binding protein UgpC [candidate division KSB1 bacterium]|nr:sn-glycerol-3-phosphate ABC transporter ATP-binding protein UgpC [candidate division KSB1 bacterium]